jgi:hypothetical protein
MVRIHTKPEYQMMTPDTRHTQASVQITTKTPFSFRCHNNFSAQIQQYNHTAYKTTSAFTFVLSGLQLLQRLFLLQLSTNRASLLLSTFASAVFPFRHFVLSPLNSHLTFGFAFILVRFFSFNSIPP